MTAHPCPRTTPASSLLPATAPAPGELLWGEAPRRQPIAPLVLMAVVLLLIATPTALAGNGGSSNPITSMKQIAQSTYELTGLMSQSNKTLATIDANSRRLAEVQEQMGGISTASAGMADSTTKLASTLGEVGVVAAGQRKRLANVDAKLATTVGGMGQTRKDVSGSLAATQGIAKEFGVINTSIAGMRTSLNGAIGQMAASVPLTQEFANNRTRTAVAGGDPSKFHVPNFAPNNRVMSIVLPMIKTMQEGGRLPARKDSQTASNPVIGATIGKQVPNGANVMAIIKPFDGTLGLPGPQFFVQNQVNGF